MLGTVISKGKVDGFRSRLRLKPVWVNQENYQNEQLSIFNSDGKGCSLLSIFIAVLGTCSEMKRENNKYWLNSGKEKYIADGGKNGRKKAYQKPDEKLQEEYAGVIKQLRKGYLIRMIAKSEGVGVSTVQRMKKKFVDNVA